MVAPFVLVARTRPGSFICKIKHLRSAEPVTDLTLRYVPAVLRSQGAL